MQKRYFVAMVFAVVLAKGLFAQEEPWGGKKEFLSVDVGAIALGLRYERLLESNFSMGADIYWSNIFAVFNEMEIGIFGRWYQSNGQYMELGLGLHAHSGYEDLTYVFSDGDYVEDGSFAALGLAISPAWGWKFDPGKPGGFFVEPQITVPVTIGWKDYLSMQMKDRFAIGIGLVFFVGLGWSF